MKLLKLFLITTLFSFILWNAIDVQALEDKEMPNWLHILNQASDVERTHSTKQSSYTEIKKDFSQYFSTPLRMTIFTEHLMYVKEGYQFGATDFSPYMLAKYIIDDLELLVETNDTVVVKEKQKAENDLLSPYQMVRTITLKKYKGSLKITKITWEVIKTSESQTVDK